MWIAANIVRLHTAALGAARDERDASSVASGPMGFHEMNDCLPLRRSESPVVGSPGPAFEVPKPLYVFFLKCSSQMIRRRNTWRTCGRSTFPVPSPRLLAER